MPHRYLIDKVLNTPLHSMSYGVILALFSKFFVNVLFLYFSIPSKLKMMWVPRIIFKGAFNSWRKSLSYGKQSIDLQCKPVDWFLYDKDLRHERVETLSNIYDDTFCVVVERFSKTAL